MIVYCATSNPGKLREFQLAAPDFDVRALPKSVPPPEENGDTFEANAIDYLLLDHFLWPFTSSEAELRSFSD